MEPPHLGQPRAPAHPWTGSPRGQALGRVPRPRALVPSPSGTRKALGLPWKPSLFLLLSPRLLPPTVLCEQRQWRPWGPCTPRMSYSMTFPVARRSCQPQLEGGGCWEPGTPQEGGRCPLSCRETGSGWLAIAEPHWRARSPHPHAQQPAPHPSHGSTLAPRCGQGTGTDPGFSHLSWLCDFGPASKLLWAQFTDL